MERSSAFELVRVRVRLETYDPALRLGERGALAPRSELENTKLCARKTVSVRSTANYREILTLKLTRDPFKLG